MDAVTLDCQPFTRATLLSSPAYSPTPSLPHSLTDFGIILTVRNGNASDLIAPRRDPPRSAVTINRTEKGLC